MKIIKEIQTLSQERRKLLEQQNEVFKIKMHECFKELFNLYPKLEEFSWTQYAPYFNDWDECIFSVYCDYPLLKFEWMEERSTCDDYYFQRWDSETRTYINNTEEDKKSIFEAFKVEQSYVEEVENAVREIVWNIPEDILKDMFDAWEVVVTKDWIEVEDYDHD